MSNETTVPSWAIALARRADDYFLRDSTDGESVADVAGSRIGLLVCFAASAGTLGFLPFWLDSWPLDALLITAALSAMLLVLPWFVRHTWAIRWLGHVASLALWMLSALAVWLSAGQDIALLPFLPLLPLIGLLVDGRRGTFVGSVLSLGLAVMGAFLVSSGAVRMTAYGEAASLAAYVTVALCIFAVGSISWFSDFFWTRTAIEVADNARAALLMLGARNRSLLEHASEGVVVVNAFAVVKFASPAAERLLDVAPGESMGHSLGDFTNQDDSTRVFAELRRIFTAPDCVSQMRLTTNPGRGLKHGLEPRVIDCTAANHLDNPAVEGIVVRMRDVTGQIRAEENYETLLESSLQGIAVECEGRIEYVNQTFADLLGTTRETIDSMSNKEGSPLRWVHSDPRELLRRICAARNRLDHAPVEVRFFCGDGEWRWLQIRWSLSSWAGKPAMQIACADVTAQRALAERQEQEKERLASAIAERTRELEGSLLRLKEKERMATVGILAAGIAHQINNPVGAILASAEFALLVSDDVDTDQIRDESLVDIREQATRCGRIVRSVLQFARAEPTEKWSHDLTSILRTSVDLTTSYAEERGGKIELVLAPEAIGLTVLMSPIELEQVFVNLIRNAIESGPEPIGVRVTTRVVGDEIEVAVEDTGPGIDENLSDKIFEPFYTTRLNDGGTGLGLSVAHGIVMNHGGHMSLARLAGESTGGHYGGAKIEIRLPLEKPLSRA